MDFTVCDTAEKITAEIKEKLLVFLKENDLEFEIIKCCGCDRVCVDLSGDKNNCKRYCCNTGIIIQTSSKDVCRIYPYEILYIAIEDRKSVLYLLDRKVETNYRLDHWKELLDFKTFAQPHSSYLVNLCYVEEVTKDFVKINHKGKDYSIYTSSRKLKNFKNAFMECKK